MGLNTVAPNGLKTIHPFTHHASHPHMASHTLSSSFFSQPSGGNPPSARKLVTKSNLFPRGVSRNRNVSRACSGGSSDGFSDYVLCTHMDELSQKWAGANYEDGFRRHHVNGSCAVSEFPRHSRYKAGFPNALSHSKMDFPHPTLLGIHPDPPDWPERCEINRVRIAQKANRIEIPLSLRMIKRKQQLQVQMGMNGAVETVQCSVKKAFSSMVHIIRELQTCALQLTENPCYEDLKETLNKVQREMNESFVWLFRQVFSQTPTLMVYMMILLANFSLHSMAANPAIAATSAPLTPSQTISETLQETEGDDQEQFELKEDDDYFSGLRSRFLLGDDMLTIGEAILWNSLLEDATKMRGDILDEETMQDFVAPVFAKPEAEEYDDYQDMDILYRMSLSQDPDNSLLLCNYAQFLCHVTRNYSRAEEFFQRAIRAEPLDAEAFCQYADFLWTVRKDAWAAEERYQQAIAEDPDNPHYASKYANFLWSSGADETCYPLDAPNDWYTNPEMSTKDELP